MFIIDDSALPDLVDNIEITRRFGAREITHVFHDIDGTHSLIRDWPPVMSLTLHAVIESGLPAGYDTDENIQCLVARVGKQPLPETDSFCIESAGLSALTQMEFAIRRAVEEGSISAAEVGMSPEDLAVNSQIIKRIWSGEELFDDIPEPATFKQYLKENTPRLFMVYEKILNEACRDANVVKALKDPAAWRVNGSLEFMEMLHNQGVRNYFVTGAVISYDEDGLAYGGMYDEILAVGFKVGPNQMVQALHGSTWDQKIPKIDVMKKICREEKLDPTKVLIIGDGRSEIAAGVAMGAVTISRLPDDADRQRELHKELGTNVIVSDYTSPQLGKLFRSE